MNRIIFLLGFMLLFSCVSRKGFQSRKEAENIDTITLYGKIGRTYGKDAGVFYTPVRYKVMNSSFQKKNGDWPDSLAYGYIKVKGVLMESNIKIDTTISDIQYNYIKYYFDQPQVQIIYDDSLICLIDSLIGRCVEMRRFFNRLQIDNVLDSLSSNDSLFFALKDYNSWSTRPSSFYKVKNSKVVIVQDLSFMKYEGISEYFILNTFPCSKDSEYNIEMLHVKIVEGQKIEKKFKLTGNCKKIKLTPN